MFTLVMRAGIGLAHVLVLDTANSGMEQGLFQPIGFSWRSDRRKIKRLAITATTNSAFDLPTFLLEADRTT